MLSALPPLPQTRQVYVISRFEISNPIYEHLHKLKHMQVLKLVEIWIICICRIWGSPVIAYCSQKEMPLPDKPRELYSMVLKDVVVSFTGLSPEVKAYLKILWCLVKIILGCRNQTYQINGWHYFSRLFYERRLIDCKQLRIHFKISSLFTMFITFINILLGCSLLEETNLPLANDRRLVAWRTPTCKRTCEQRIQRVCYSDFDQLCKCKSLFHEFIPMFRWFLSVELNWTNEMPSVEQ
jgi:hypothetical protein